MNHPTSPCPAAASDVLLDAASLSGPLAPAALFGHPDVDRPLELEVGCGKGRFLLAAAARWPGRDFLAVEQSRGLLRKVAERVRRAGLPNVRLHHGNARDLVARLLPAACLHRVHVQFPDPWPKRRHAKHRLFHGDFPEQLARALRPGGELLLVTDHDAYFREVLARLAARPEFVRTLPDGFRDLPPSGFELLFAAQDTPVLRATWQLVMAGAGPSALEPGP